MLLYNNNSKNNNNDHNNKQQAAVRTGDVITFGKRVLRCRKKLLTILLVNTLLWFFLWCNAYEVYYQMTLRITPQKNSISHQDNDKVDLPQKEEKSTPDDAAAVVMTPTLEETSSDEQDRLANFEIEMVNRRQRVKEVCNASSEASANDVVNYRELFLQKERGLAWCPVFKAASTTWMTYFVEMSNASEDDKKHYRKIHFRRTNEVARELYPRINTGEELQQFYSAENGTVSQFMVVRHPFHRLVSAFRDKLERTSTVRARNDYYYKLYGQKIVSRYREKAKKKFGAKFFEEQNNFGTPIRPGRVGFRNSLNPTFWEFVQFVKDAKRPASVDIHWQPMSTFCSVCSLQYDYYLKFESMVEEESLFLEARNLSSVLNRHWMNGNKPAVPGLDQDQLTKKYFEQLDDEDVMALYNMYEMDFKMFDYKFEFRNIVLPL